MQNCFIQVTVIKTAELQNLGTLAFTIKFKFGNQMGITELKWKSGQEVGLQVGTIGC